MVISTSSLSRSYRTYQKQPGFMGSIRGFWDRKHQDKVALASTDLQISGGQIIGLVGANGAGKTTLLKLLSGLIYPSTGTATVLGHVPWERKNEYLRQMSILLGQKNQLWWDISALDSYTLLAEIYDLQKNHAMDRVQELATMLDCTSVLKTQLRRLSLGERMKMEIIGALLHQPKVLFLDEPTIGLDIVAQASIRKFLAQYVKERSPTVILTSHYMDDIAKLADQLLLISKGQIVYNGTVNGFMARTENKQKIIFSLSEPSAREYRFHDQTFAAGTQEFSVEVTDKELPQTLSQITQVTNIGSLKIDQVDFEEIIHQFLQTGLSESRP